MIPKFQSGPDSHDLRLHDLQLNAITSTFNSAPLESSVRPRPRCSSKEQVPLDCPLSKDVKNL